MSNKSEFEWYVPASVLNALWGTLMPRVAALVWRTAFAERFLGGGARFPWPPKGKVDDVPGENGGPSLERRRVMDLDGEDCQAGLTDFWNAMFDVTFGAPKDDQKRMIPDALDSLHGVQRAAFVVLDYFRPTPKASGQPLGARIPLRVIGASAYDFVLSSGGLDIFVPEDPFKDDADADGKIGRSKILQMYKFREAGHPPIGLPGNPASFGDGKGGACYHVPIPQMTSPTGAFQIHEQWVRCLSNKVKWWLSGTSYRGMMAALPRVIADVWYEEVAWEEYVWPEGLDAERTADSDSGRFYGGKLNELLQDRMETPLPQDLSLSVVNGDAGAAAFSKIPGWNPNDVMITDKGFFFPNPGKAPKPEDLLAAMAAGQAGNPVFTDTAPQGIGGS